MVLLRDTLVVAIASWVFFVDAKDPASIHTFTVSAGTLDPEITATMIIDGNVFLNNQQQIVAPNGTPVRFTLENATMEMKTPLPGGDRGYPVGALVVATPGCGQSVPASVNVFYFPGNTAHGGSCGAAAVLEKFLTALPKSTPVAMTTLYNQKGWEVFRCPNDVMHFQKSVQLLGGKYSGSLGTQTSDPSGGDYKSAYLLVGAVGGDAVVEKYCTSDMETSTELLGNPIAQCGFSYNGASIEKVNITVPACSDEVVV